MEADAVLGTIFDRLATGVNQRRSWCREVEAIKHVCQAGLCFHGHNTLLLFYLPDAVKHITHAIFSRVAACCDIYRMALSGSI